MANGAFAAATGIKLKDADDSTNWAAGKSRAMCELASMTREILREASSPDRTLCYVGQMQSLGKFGSAVDDGSYKYFTISFDSTPSMKVKFKIVKDATGSITNYEMFTCNTSNSGATYAQKEYTSLTLTTSTASIVAKGIGSEGAATYGSSTSVTGALDSSGNWTSKLIESGRNFTDGNGAFNQKLTITQGSNYMTLNGDNRYTGTNFSAFIMKLYGKVQILNASSLQTLAFGDGSAKADMTYGGVSAGSGTTHWLGDTRAVTSSSDYAADVAAASIRTDGGTVSVTFATAETWDCSAPSGSSFVAADITSANMSQLQTACDDVYGFGSGESGGGYACGNANGN
ncbi:MAG: hypothetical protein JNM39_10090 [Bdellovibrionaceae bacterium]|nr:hypothetical protein [Pseudobdellovibrionaceae bacterium]